MTRLGHRIIDSDAHPSVMGGHNLLTRQDPDPTHPLGAEGLAGLAPGPRDFSLGPTSIMESCHQCCHVHKEHDREYCEV